MSPAPVTRAAGAPLRIAALVKQVPLAESLRLEDGRLVRRGVDLEMNAYCRRAVAQGVTLAGATGGSCTVVTLGPPSAEDVLREAVAWGADAGLHVCDEAFAGSDTLATARALAAALRAAGPFDLVLLGRNSIDGETGQVGPELAELLDLPFASGVRRLEDLGAILRLELEHDDGTQEVEIALPAVLSVAERLCDPCKVDPEGRAAVPAERLHPARRGRARPRALGRGGEPDGRRRDAADGARAANLVLEGPVEEQVERGGARAAPHAARWTPGAGARRRGGAGRPRPRRRTRPAQPASRVIAVLVEPGRPEVAAELLGAAARLGRRGRCGRARAGADRRRPRSRPGHPPAPTSSSALGGSRVAEDVADAVAAYVRETGPWAAAGAEHRLRPGGGGAGGRGDRLGTGGRRHRACRRATARWWPPSRRSPARWWPTSPAAAPPRWSPCGPACCPRPRAGTATRTSPRRPTRAVGTRGRVRVLAERRNDDVETLARAEVVIGVGTGVEPEEYEQLSPLAALLGAELAATRKVTDRGWAPRARQVGITGRSIAPRLYVALGLSGKFNHMVGVRAAGTILAVNADPGAPVFAHCDVGIVGDWHEVVPLLHEALRAGAVGHGAARPVRPAPSERR